MNQSGDFSLILSSVIITISILQRTCLHIKVCYGICVKLLLRARHTDGEWADIKRKVTDDLHWDEETYNWIRKSSKAQQGKAAVISMADETRRKFEYWRDIRNVCAHYKEYHFLKAHTVTLYSFIEQYLLTFTVEGSVSVLVREFNEFYDPQVTEKGTPIEPLILKIPKMVQISEIPDFINKLNASFYLSYSDDGYYVLLNKISHVLPQQYVDAFFEDLQLFKPSFYGYIFRYPEMVSKLLVDKKEVRTFWQNKLPSYSEGAVVLANMLEAGMIIDSEIESALEVFQKGMYRRNEYFECKDENVENSLRRFGYYTVFKKVFWNEDYLCGYYDRARQICYKTDFFVSMLWKLDIDKDTVATILAMFTNDTRPFTLCKRFLEEFKTDKGYWDRFLEVVNANGLVLPDRLVNNQE